MREKRSVSLRPTIDRLEIRQMLDAGTSSLPISIPALPKHTSALSIPLIKQYYGITGLTFDGKGGQVTADGAGQTIVILSASRDASYTSSDQPGWSSSALALYSGAMGLPSVGSSAPDQFSFKLVNEEGDSNPADLPPAATGSATEFDLDTQAAHSIAPQAKIVDIVLNSSTTADFNKGVATALKLFAPTVISISYGSQETSAAKLGPYVDGNGTTYVRSAGDAGTGRQYGYPRPHASSPIGNTSVKRYEPMSSVNALTVLVGGTRLTYSKSQGFNDTVWGAGAYTYLGRVDHANFPGKSGTGGGFSLYNPRPRYQVDSPYVNANQSKFPAASRGKRLGPDLSMMSMPGILILTYNSTTKAYSWLDDGGTSLSAPMFSGVMAIVGQGRAAAGLAPLSSSQTLNLIYHAPEQDFQDITSGNNGYPALKGFDLASGRGAVQQGLIRYLADTVVAAKA